MNNYSRGRVQLTEVLLPRIARLASNYSIDNCLSNFNKIDKLEKFELRTLSSIRVSNRIIPPSERGSCKSGRVAGRGPRPPMEKARRGCRRS